MDDNNPICGEHQNAAKFMLLQATVIPVSGAGLFSN